MSGAFTRVRRLGQKCISLITYLASAAGLRYLRTSLSRHLVRVRVLHAHAARPRPLLCAECVTGFGGVRGLLPSGVCGRRGGGAGRGKVLGMCARAMCAFGAARAWLGGCGAAERGLGGRRMVCYDVQSDVFDGPLLERLTALRLGRGRTG
jgi:hypothetical protein